MFEWGTDNGQRLTQDSPKQELLKTPCVMMFWVGNRHPFCWSLSVVLSVENSRQICQMDANFRTTLLSVVLMGFSHLDLEIWPDFWTKSPVEKDLAQHLISGLTFSHNLFSQQSLSSAQCMVNLPHQSEDCLFTKFWPTTTQPRCPKCSLSTDLLPRTSQDIPKPQDLARGASQDPRGAPRHPLLSKLHPVISPVQLHAQVPL